MSDTASQGISVNVGMLQSKYDEISEIDEKLDAASGNEQAGKRALSNRIAEETKSQWEDPVSNIVSSFNQIEDLTVLIGAINGLQKLLKDNFGEKTEAYLKEQVEASKKDAPQVSADEVEQLLNNRKDLVNQYRALKNMLDVFGIDSSSVPEPKKMTGSRGKRGPRVLTNYAFSIDGKELSASQNSLSAVANNICKDIAGGWKVKDLREFLTAQGIDLTNPPSEFEVTLPNNKVLGAKVVEVDDDDVEDEPADEDNE